MFISKDIEFHTLMRFGSLVYGDTFLFDGSVYMKAGIVDMNDPYNELGELDYHPVAIELEDGIQEEFDNETIVEVLNLEIHPKRIN